jgi:N-acyl-D-amino-acid deacylase
MFDLVIGGGEVLDGFGGPPLRADVGVRDGRVAALGDLGDAAAGERIDATGRYVTPGFIDAHSHADALVGDPEVQLANLRQGVTTVILGQDGLSFAPATAPTSAFVARYFAAIHGGADPGPLTVAELLASYRHTTALNTAYLVPHGTVRHAVLGGAPRPPEKAELAAMRGLVEQGLADGAVGLSTGLEYLPGRHADAAELVALCAPVAAAGLPHVSHMRGYGLSAADGVAELRAVAVGSGVATHISHFHGPSELLLSLLDDARAAGLDVTVDSYPYLRGCTILAMAALPRWVDATDPDAAAAALTDPAVRSRILAELDPTLWPRIALAWVPARGWRWAQGRRLTEVAAEAGQSPAQTCLDLLVATGLRVTAVFDQPPTTSDESVRAILRHPAHLAGSDGIHAGLAYGAHPHPRGYGAFARLLGRHTRELGDWTWPQAVTHLAAHAAARFRLADRGVLRVGAAADIAVLDPARVADEATYEQPRRPAVGVDDVVVNGVVALRAGALTGARPGTPLRPA